MKPLALLLALALPEADLEEHPGAQVPLDLAFTDDGGRAVTLRELAGKPIFLVLAYFRCPSLCDLTLQGAAAAVREADRALEGKYSVVTVSFDPRDTSQAAANKRKATLELVGAPRAWPFLVGGEAQSRALADSLGFIFSYDKRTGQYAHPAATFVLTPDGRVARYLYGPRPQPRDLKLALVEAGQGKIGSLVDRVIVSCFKWDPSQRRYGPHLLGLLRFGAGLVMLALSALLFLLFRRERRP